MPQTEKREKNEKTGQRGGWKCTKEPEHNGLYKLYKQFILRAHSEPLKDCEPENDPVKIK